MLIHSIIDCSEVNGPGKRTVVWLQGCQGMDCPGCWNAETHPFTGPYTNPLDVVDRILKAGMDGVTFSGGEPLQQLNEGLQVCIRSLKAARPEISIGLYTGYTPHELETGNYRWEINSPSEEQYPAPKYRKIAAWEWLKDRLDFAVMGRFNQAQLDASRPLCSSRNQDLVLFSDRYKLSDFRPQETEIIVSADRVVITGFPVGIV